MSSLFKKAPPTCICVEIFDVIATCPLDSYKKFAAETYGCTPEQVESAVLPYWVDLELGKLKPDEFWDKVGADLKEMGVSHEVPGWKFKGIWDVIVADNVKLNNEMVKTLRNAKDIKTRTVACTNMFAEVATAMQKAGAFDPFNMAVVSSQITARKPTAEMFSRISKLARTKPAQCVYIDKDPANLEAAKAAGFVILPYADDPQDTRWQLLQMGLLR